MSYILKGLYFLSFQLSLSQPNLFAQQWQNITRPDYFHFRWSKAKEKPDMMQKEIVLSLSLFIVTKEQMLQN